MNHRERILAAVDRRPTDILPVGFKATDDVLRRLKAHFGADDILSLVRALPVDTYGVFNNALWGVYPSIAASRRACSIPTCGRMGRGTRSSAIAGAGRLSPAAITTR